MTTTTPRVWHYLSEDIRPRRTKKLISFQIYLSHTMLIVPYIRVCNEVAAYVTVEGITLVA